MNQIAARWSLAPLLLPALASLAGCSSAAPGATAEVADAAADVPEPIVVVVPMDTEAGDAAVTPPAPDAALPEAAEDAAEDQAVDGAGPADGGASNGASPDAQADGTPEANSAPVEAGPPPCAASQTRCGGQCVDTTSDVHNCGACSQVCPGGAPNASPTCVGSACSSACDPGFHTCGGSCADETSLATCGSACTPCSAAPIANASATCAPSGSGYACSWSCDPGYLLCNGVCLDVANDPENCGACGHVCDPGTCSAGVCQAWTVASMTQASVVASDGSYVLWAAGTSPAALFSAPLGTIAVAPDVGSHLALGTLGSGVPRGLAVGSATAACALSDDPSASYSLVLNASERVTSSTESYYGAVQGVAGGIAVGNGMTTTYMTASDGTNVTVTSCILPPLNTKQVGCDTVATFSGSAAGAIVANDTAAYWADPGNGRVSEYVIATQTVSDVVDSQPGASLVALDASHLFWTTFAGGASGTAIHAMSLIAPGTTQTIAPSLGPVVAMVSDGAHLYFVQGGSTILSVPVAGGAQTVVFTPPPSVSTAIASLTYSSGSLYWADPDRNAVFGQRVP